VKLFFNHVVGKVADMDFYYSPVYAHFEPHEEAEAVNSGWLINEWDASLQRKWFQSRVVRLDLKDWRLSESEMDRMKHSGVVAVHTSLYRVNAGI
jgi:hypothetical protein